MIVWIVILAVFTMRQAKVFNDNGVSQYYISKDGSNAVRGIFILLIMASHFSTYVPAYTQPIDLYYQHIRAFLGQLVVCMFFFYSGYGVTLSFAEKGKQYQQSFLRKRVLATLLIFDLALLFYYAVQRELGKSYTVKHYLLAMLAWSNMGNSNWYIFAIVVLYFISWVSAMSNTTKNGLQEVSLLIVGTLVFTQLQMCANRDPICYNTLFCYPLGAAFYYLRPYCEKFLRKPLRYYLTLLGTASAFLLMHRFWRVHLVIYEITALLFTILVVLITMKFEIRNRILRLAGKHLNELFLMHRIPMILLGRVPYIKQHVHLYFALSVFFACICAFLFSKLVNLLRGNIPPSKSINI